MSNTINSIESVKIGDIFTRSWGYDQTNINFFQVTRKTKKCIFVREIESTRDYDAQTMTGHALPKKGAFKGKEVKKTPYKYINDTCLNDGRIYINFEYGCGQSWDGKKESYSDYA